MMEDELVKIWQSSPNQERIKFEKSRLILEVQSGIDRLDKSIKYRDLSETIAVAIVVPAFIVIVFRVPFTLSKIAAALIVVWAIYVLIRLIGARKHKPGPLTENYLDYLHKNRQHLNAQKQLVETALYWYMLPAHILVSLFTLGYGRLPFFIKMQVAGLILGTFAFVRNKIVIKKTYKPRLDKIEQLIQVLEKE
jgi:hypothetical protein